MHIDEIVVTDANILLTLVATFIKGNIDQCKRAFDNKGAVEGR